MARGRPGVVAPPSCDLIILVVLADRNVAIVAKECFTKSRPQKLLQRVALVGRNGPVGNLAPSVHNLAIDHIVHTVKVRNVQRATRSADQVLASVKEAVRLKAMRRTG